MRRIIKNPIYGTSDVFGEWDLFILRHNTTPNVIGHIPSVFLFWGSPILAWIYNNPFFLIGFFVSGLVGTASHYLSKEGTVDAKEATSSFKAVLFSTTMAVLFILGAYKEQVLQAKEKLKRYLDGKIKTTFPAENLKKIGLNL